MTPAAAIADLDRRVAAVHAALDEDRAPDLPPFEPAPIEGPVSSAERDALLAAMDRLQAACRRIEDRRATLLEDRAGLGARRHAAARYAAGR